MREPEVEAVIRRYLAGSGWEVRVRHRMHGPDIEATRDGKTLLVEVKGDRPGHQSSPGTIHVDVMTLLGQVVHRKGQGGEDFAIAVRPVHERLVRQALPVLRQLAVRAFLVKDDETVNEL